jgi:hypothetical protein
MELRFKMDTNDGRFVEMPHTNQGRNFLKGLRKGRSDLFKHARIREVIQALPSQITVGILHKYS